MSEKYVIFGATGSIGSSLAEQLKNSGNDIHLVARNESELSSASEKTWMLTYRCRCFRGWVYRKS